MNQLYVADYNDWVKVEDEIWLERIRKNISAGQYSTRTAFLAGFQQLVINATDYNEAGHGLYGDQGHPLQLPVLLLMSVGTLAF